MHQQNTKKRRISRSFSFLLSHQDSNLDRQNQNLQCYHYTKGQLITGCKNNKINHWGGNPVDFL